MTPESVEGVFAYNLSKEVDEQRQNRESQQNTLMAISELPPFQTTFAVPLHCDGCVKDITTVLNKLSGITRIDADVSKQLVYIEGTTPPSAIVEAIEGTGRDAILRGSGKSNSAGVCILETHADVKDPVKGLARMVEVGSGMTLIDLTIKGFAPGTYYATVRERGDISQGAATTGGIWDAIKNLTGMQNEKGRGSFGQIKVGKDGRGNAFLEKPFSIWEVIGRSMVISSSETGPFARDDSNVLVGVIARSAGVWENDKSVCSCTGKTVWEERKEQQGRGMM